MSTPEALRILVSLGLLLFLMRPITGLFLDLLKIMLIMSLTGVVLMVIPADWIDHLSQNAAGWTRVTGVYVPVICLLALVAMSTINITFLTGTIEQVVKGVFYIVGGVFTINSAEWVAWDKSVGSLVVGALGIALNALKIFQSVVNP